MSLLLPSPSLLLLLLTCFIANTHSAIHNPLLSTTNETDSHCFNCNLERDHCWQFASCSRYDGQCSCPAGWGLQNCSRPVCGALTDDDRLPLPTDQAQCECKEGWSGPTCNMCTQDQVCPPFVDESTNASHPRLCYQGDTVIQHNYHVCSVENKVLKEALGDKRAQVSYDCNRKEDYCRLEFWVNDVENFYCYLRECQFNFVREKGVNYTTSICNKAQCKCVHKTFMCNPDDLDVTEMLAHVEGPASLKCRRPGYDNDRYNCEFDEKIIRENLGVLLGANPVIELGCTGGECIVAAQYPTGLVISDTFSLWFILLLGGAIVLGTIGFGWLFNWLVKRNRVQRMYLVEGEDGQAKEEMERVLGGQHTPAQLVFRDVGYEVLSNAEVDASGNGASGVGGHTGEEGRWVGGSRVKRLLRGVHGLVNPGEMLAIMGSSGAGKTTLLDILAGKAKRGVVTGEILVNGRTPTRQEFKRISGYVDQEDTLMSTLTVYETLLYSAMLRLPRTMSMAAKRKRVEETMVELGIEHIANQKIGRPGARGISGGEKRRVSIATEVVTGPSILYLDEPTSGLDSYNALSVIQALETLAKKYGRTIVVTIHQPRSNIFAMFDKLLLLGVGGYMIYSGPLWRRVHVAASAVEGCVEEVDRVRVRSTRPASILTHRPMESNSTAVSQPMHSVDHSHQPDSNEYSSSTNVTEETIQMESILQKWLLELGISCPPGFNLADYLIDITNRTYVNQQAANGLTLSGSRSDGKESSFQQLRRRRRADDMDPEASSARDTPDLKPEPRTSDSDHPRTATPQDGMEHLPLSSSDYSDLITFYPHLAALVTGFLRSDICLKLKHELDDVELQHEAEESRSPMRSRNRIVTVDPFSPTLRSMSPAVAIPIVKKEKEGPSSENPGDESIPLLHSDGQPPPESRAFGPGSINPSFQQFDPNNDDALAFYPQYSPYDSQNMSIQRFNRQFLNMWDSIIRFVEPKQPSLRPTFWMQFRILSGRTFTNFYRNPFLMWAHYGLAIVLALFCGFMFSGMSLDISGQQSRLGFIFFTLAMFGFTTLSSLTLFAQERTLFMRERANGFYGVGVYYLSKILFDIIPLRVIPPLLYGSISYFIVGLVPGFEHFYKFVLVLVLFNLTAASLCLIIAVSCGENVAVANLIGVMSILFSMLSSGFLLSKNQYPALLRWIPYCSYYYYAMEAMLANEFLTIFLRDKRLNIPIDIAGPAILDMLGFNAWAYWPDVVSLTWLFILFLIIAFIILQVFVKEKR